MAAPLSVHDGTVIREYSREEVTEGICCRDGCGVRKCRYLRVGRVRGLNCDQPLRVVRGCGAVEVWACSNHRESKCVPCSWKYRRLLGRLAEAGTRDTGFMYLLTITAPGDRVHRLPSGDLCPCTPAGGVNLSMWNPTAASRWNSLLTRLRSMYPELEYLRAVEVQDGKRRADGVGRGALHLHIIVYSAVPLDRAQLRRMAIGYGFGHALDLASIVPGSRKHAYYVAKYVTKAADQRGDVPWRPAVPVCASCGHVRPGQVCEGCGLIDPDLLQERMHTAPTFRAWSASRGWGLTMKQIRTACAHAARRPESLEDWLPDGTIAGDSPLNPQGIPPPP